LKQRKRGDDAWFELTTQEAKAKVSHAIRDAIAAKDKTKANKSGPASNIKILKEDPPAPPLQGSRKMLQQHRGSLSSIGSTSDICMLPPHNLSPSPNLSVSSMGQPIFAMGPQQFGGNSANLAQDQIQALRQQAIGLHSSVTPAHSFAHGMQVTGLPQIPEQQQMMPQQIHHQHQLQRLQQLQQQQHHLQQLQEQQMLAQQQAPQLAAFQQLPFSALPIDPPEERQAAGPSVARAPRGPGCTSSSSDTDDGDGDFLSLIDTVLGPMGPNGPQGKKD
jgi:hypothetical protein